MNQVKEATDHAMVMLDQAIGLISTAVLSSPDKNVVEHNMQRIRSEVEAIKSEVRNIQILL